MRNKKGLKKVKAFTCKGCGEKPQWMQDVDVSQECGSWRCPLCMHLNTMTMMETTVMAGVIQQGHR